jgi:cell wall-associated NlpC family hydrolase
VHGVDRFCARGRFATVCTLVTRASAAAAGALLCVTLVLGLVPSDVGTAGASSSGVAALTGIPSDNFWLASAQGAVWNFGSAGAFGSVNGPLNHPVVAITATKDGQGYWLVASDGGIFSYGDAAFYGSTGAIALNKPIVGMAPTPDGKGYWMVASDGGIFSYGDATFYGSTGAIALNKPIVGMAPTPDGKGYWLVASDGGIFSYGDATFYGSTGAIHLAQPIVGMAPAPDGKGYWMVASDGGIFNYGDAGFYGSAAGAGSLDPTEKVVADHSGDGYWVEEQNGTAYGFGDAEGAPPTEALLFQPVTQGDKAVLFAFAQLGKPYIWGGNGPVGYDCSGLALASWENGDGIGFARVANDQYDTAGGPVALTNLGAGDLVFWGNSQTDWTSVYHTAIYVGGNRIVEATGNQVQLNSIDQWGLSDLMPNGRRP